MSEKAVAFYDVEVFPNTFMVTFLYPGGDHEMWTVWHDSFREIDQRAEIVEYLRTKRTYVGFNSKSYDDQIMAKFSQLAKYNLPVKDFTKQLYKHSVSIIKKTNQWLRNPIQSVDLQRITQKGRQRKSLKEIAINLRWPLIKDLPQDPHQPVNFEDLTDMYRYNLNDCQITEELYRYIHVDVQLRINVSRQYRIRALNLSNSQLGDKVLEKMYANEVGHTQFLDARTPRDVMPMTEIINPDFDFESPYMQNFLQQLKKEQLRLDDEMEYQVRIGNLTYAMKKGGLHSEHPAPIIHQSNKTHGIWDLDVSSFYPMLMITMGIRPAHLDDSFLTVLDKIVKQRLQAKAIRKDKTANEKAKQQAEVDAEALKIAINAVFGKLGYEGGWLYDPLALYRVTINGQLLLLRLIESVERLGRGFRVIYGNTDGISVYGPRSERHHLESACNEWQEQFNLTLETTEFSKFVLRDVNNYLVIKSDGSVKAKGALNKDNLKDPTLMQGLMKKFEYPVVLDAIHNYFVEGKSVADTIKERRDILDFAISQKVGKTYSRVSFTYIEDFQLRTEEGQRTNRYAVVQPRFGGSLLKHKGDSQHVAIKGAHLVLLNDVDSKPEARSWIYEPWYIREAEKVIAPFLQTQGELFTC